MAGPSKLLTLSTDACRGSLKTELASTKEQWSWSSTHGSKTSTGIAWKTGNIRLSMCQTSPWTISIRPTSTTRSGRMLRQWSKVNWSWRETLSRNSSRVTTSAKMILLHRNQWRTSHKNNKQWRRWLRHKIWLMVGLSCPPPSSSYYLEARNDSS